MKALEWHPPASLEWADGRSPFRLLGGRVDLRDARTGRRSVGWLGFVTCAAALLVARPAVTEPEARLDFTVRAGLEGHVRRGCWSSAVLEARNRGGDFSGVVSVLVPGETTEFMRPFELPRSSVRRIEVPFRPGTVPGRLLVRVRSAADDAVVWSAECPLVEVEARRHLLCAYGSGDAGLLRALLQDERAHGSNLLARALPRNALAESPRAYEALQALVLVGPEDGSISAPQARALADWVRHGGHLVFVWQIGWHPERALSEEIGPPVEAVEEVRLSDFADFRGFAREPIQATELLAARARPAAGAATIFPAPRIPLVVSRRLGRGRVTWVGIDLSRPLWAEWPGTAELWRRILAIPASPPQERGLFAAADPDDPSAWTLPIENERVRAALVRTVQPHVSWLEPGWLALFTSVYILLSGPGIYLLFRRRRRGVPAVAAFPLTVLLFSGVATAVSGRMHTSEQLGYLASVVDVAGDGAGVRGSTYGLLLFPRNVTVRVRSPRPTTWMSPLYDSGSAGAGPVTAGGWSSVATRFERAADGAELAFGARSWTAEFLQAEWEEDGKAPVRAQLAAARAGGGEATLTVDNGTDGPLDGVTLVRAGKAVALEAALPPGRHAIPLAGRPAAGLLAWALPRPWTANDPWSTWRSSLPAVAVLGLAENPCAQTADALAAAGFPAGLFRVFDPGAAAGRRTVLYAWSSHHVPPLAIPALARPPEQVTLFRVEVEVP